MLSEGEQPCGRTCEGKDNRLSVTINSFPSISLRSDMNLAFRSLRSDTTVSTILVVIVFQSARIHDICGQTQSVASDGDDESERTFGRLRVQV